MFGRKKDEPAPPLLKPQDDVPPLPLNFQPRTPARPLPPAPPPSAAPAVSPVSAPVQGSAMAESPAAPTPFRPEMPRRPGPPEAGVAAKSSPLATGPAKPGPDPKTLIVGREISLNGQITACDRLVVEGKVEASLSDSRFIEISETGTFKGNADIEEAEIRGQFDGKLSVSGRLLIRGTGKVIGEIRYGQIEIELGGQISGTVQTTGVG